MIDKIPVAEIIALFFILKLMKNRRRQLYRSSQLRSSQNLFVRILGDLGGIDCVARFIQFLLIFIGGLYEKNSKFKTTHTRLVMISSARKIDHISNFFAIVRKITRYPRTFGLLKDLNQQIKRYPTSSYSLLIKMDAIFGILGNAFNLAFFFGDHYLGLFIAGIFTNKNHVMIADYWSTMAWFWSTLFLLFKDFTMYKIWMKNQQYQVGKKKKFLIFLIIDVIRNIMDTMSNIAYFYDGMFSKELIGFLGFASALLWLSDFYQY